MVAADVGIGAGGAVVAIVEVGDGVGGVAAVVVGVGAGSAAVAEGFAARLEALSGAACDGRVPLRWR